MPKIIHIINSLRLGGEEKFLLDIYPFLSKKFDHVICPFLHIGELYPETKTMKVEKSKNSAFWVYLFKSRAFYINILKPFLFFYYFYRISVFLKKEKPIAVITYTTTPDLPLALRAIFSIHKRQFKWYSRICFHLDRVVFLPAFPYNQFSSRFYQRGAYYFLLSIMHFHIKLFAKRADCVITLNHTLKDELETITNIDQKKIFLMPVCLPMTAFETNPLPSFILDKKPFFIAAGRLERVKGFDFLIETFAIFLKARPDFNLIIFGEGSHRETLKKLITSLGLEEKILLPGYVKNPAALSIHAISFIVPSRSEAFGKIIIEGMHSRSIVIASNCIGPKNIITHDVNGLLFERENKASLINAMNDVIEMADEKKERLKKNAYDESLKYRPECVAELLNLKLEADCLS